MKISELRDGMSLKYEALAIKEFNQDAYTLVGMFMTLPSKVSVSLVDQVPGIFVGYIKGSSQLKTLRIYLTNNDKDAKPKSAFFKNDGILVVNINRISATRMPKTVSDYLKQLHKNYQKNIALKAEMDKLKNKTNETDKTIREISNTLSKTLIKDTKVEYKKLPDGELYNLAVEILNKYNHKHHIYEIASYRSTTNQKLNITVAFNKLYNPSGLGLFREYDGSVLQNETITNEQIYKLLVESDKKAIDFIKYRLDRIKGIEYKFEIDTQPHSDFSVSVFGYYTILIKDKAAFEKIIESIGNIF